MEVHKPWSAEQIPDQSGKVVLITGANSGLGYESALALARAGAQVIMGCRNSEKSETARQQILEQVPGASVALQALDLSSLGSIRGAARQVKSAQSRLDILINNAGVMATPRRTTADGFELQFGTNHLGHFALTGLLLDLSLATPRSRIVTVTSLGEYTGRIRFDDLMREKSYERWTAYGQSKLANLLFASELQRKLEAAGAETISLAAHPGFSSTNLRQTQLQEAQPIHQRLLFNLFEMPGQSATMGALPQLYAATAPDVQGGDYYGPGGFFQVRGYPKLVKPSGQARDREVARRLWQVSEQLTGVDYAAVLKPA